MTQRTTSRKDWLAEKHRARVAHGREIVQSLLSLTTESIEEFEAGKTPEELERHYLGVNNRLSRASIGQAMSED